MENKLLTGNHFGFSLTGQWPVQKKAFQWPRTKESGRRSIQSPLSSSSPSAFGRFPYPGGPQNRFRPERKVENATKGEEFQNFSNLFTLIAILLNKNSNKICIVKSSRDLCQDDGSHLLWRATIDSSRTWTSPVLGAPPAHTADKMRGVKWPIHCNLCNNKSDTKKKRTPPSLLLFGYYPPQRPLSRR